jgi:hypothetical protein
MEGLSFTPVMIGLAITGAAAIAVSLDIPRLVQLGAVVASVAVLAGMYLYAFAELGDLLLTRLFPRSDGAPMPRNVSHRPKQNNW